MLGTWSRGVLPSRPHGPAFLLSSRRPYLTPSIAIVVVHGTPAGSPWFSARGPEARCLTGFLSFDNSRLPPLPTPSIPDPTDGNHPVCAAPLRGHRDPRHLVPRRAALQANNGMVMGGHVSAAPTSPRRDGLGRAGAYSSLPHGRRDQSRWILVKSESATPPGHGPADTGPRPLLPSSRLVRPLSFGPRPNPSPSLYLARARRRHGPGSTCSKWSNPSPSRHLAVRGCPGHPTSRVARELRTIISRPNRPPSCRVLAPRYGPGLVTRRQGRGKVPD